MFRIEGVFAEIVENYTQRGLETGEKELAEEIARLKSLKNRKGQPLFSDEAQVLRIAALNVGLEITHPDHLDNIDES